MAESISPHAWPDEHRGDVGQQHARAGRGAQIDERLTGAQLPQPPGEQHHHGGGERAERGTRAPAPVGALGHRQQQGDQSYAETDRAGRVETLALRGGRILLAAGIGIPLQMGFS
ncbi:hypothetical protein [Actinomadura nitritigenes]|uniref:hypothetical protein n=1 Tax=Actinomadura nitritigenes TaxID=134602 RepID=UPI003D94524F